MCAEFNCDEQEIHYLKADTANRGMPTAEMIEKTAELFKVLGDHTRMRIICLLSGGELCVCDIAYLLKMEQSAISHQLKVLKNTRIVASRREGKTVYYSLNDEHVYRILQTAIVHMAHE